MEYSKITCALLEKRGIDSPEEIEEFFSDAPQKTYDPFLISHMDEAVAFLRERFEKKQKICIYGDYDVDGVTATAALFEFFSNFTDNLMTYIPSRFDEGYGLNLEAIDALKAAGVEVLVTVDVGIVAKNEVEYAKSLGIEVLVTDHHEPEEGRLPGCITLNPKLPGSEYPFKDICGCLVAFKLCQALERSATGASLKGKLNALLDLVSIATVCDVMPIIDENRTVLKYGIEQIKKRRRKAFALLIDKLGIEPEKVDVHKISFGLGPHFNAAGRIESAETALNFLLTKDDDERKRLVEELVEKNRERQELQRHMFQECEEYLAANYDGESAIFLRPEHIHEGVAGIVAGKVREKHNRPTFVISEANGELKASCRSISTVDIIGILQKHSELFLKMGGHKMAAGFSIAAENYDKLRELILADIGELEKEDASIFDLQTKFDLELKFTDIDKKMVKELTAFAPFGNGNPRPVFRLDNVHINKFWTVGREGEHVKGKIAGLDFISWYSADKLLPLLESKRTFAAAYGTLDINEYQGREEIQFALSLLE